jgi:phosphate-selective porin
VGGSLPAYDTYVRNFRTAYAEVIHNIEDAPLSIVVKYDRFDPNTAVSRGNAGIAGNTSVADAAFYALGFGVLWEAVDNLQVQAWYEINKTEKSSAYADPKANIFTLRCRYKF